MEQVDGIRLQNFRQLKKEIRGSDEYLIVGIDVAKERHNAFFGTAAGKTLHKGLFFDNTIEGFQKLLTITEALKIQDGLANVVFGLEPTANYHKPLGEHQLLAQYFPEMDRHFGTAVSMTVVGRCNRRDGVR